MNIYRYYNSAYSATQQQILDILGINFAYSIRGRMDMDIEDEVYVDIKIYDNEIGVHVEVPSKHIHSFHNYIFTRILMHLIRGDFSRAFETEQSDPSFAEDVYYKACELFINTRMVYDKFVQNYLPTFISYYQNGLLPTSVGLLSSTADVYNALLKNNTPICGLNMPSPFNQGGGGEDAEEKAEEQQESEDDGKGEEQEKEDKMNKTEKSGGGGNKKTNLSELLETFRNVVGQQSKSQYQRQQRKIQKLDVQLKVHNHLSNREMIVHLLKRIEERARNNPDGVGRLCAIVIGDELPNVSATPSPHVLFSMRIRTAIMDYVFCHQRDREDRMRVKDSIVVPKVVPANKARNAVTILDISGSMGSYYEPLIAGGLRIGEKDVYVFADSVEPVKRYKEVYRHDTRIKPVLELIVNKRFKNAIIISDMQFGDLSLERVIPYLMNKRINTYLMCLNPLTETIYWLVNIRPSGEYCKYIDNTNGGVEAIIRKALDVALSSNTYETF
ncbi:MAG: hypothetical protein KatS3mg083_143 [Candidatus Dojkabacteria bacterium]|nr:MAG: hypothetical protein KatS3mg083_143 [Candidatus Dojkabacteria bacterium]